METALRSRRRGLRDLLVNGAANGWMDRQVNYLAVKYKEMFAWLINLIHLSVRGALLL